LVQQSGIAENAGARNTDVRIEVRLAGIRALNRTQGLRDYCSRIDRFQLLFFVRPAECSKLGDHAIGSQSRVQNAFHIVARRMIVRYVVESLLENSNIAGVYC